MASLLKLVGFVAVGMIVFSWGLDYTVNQILLGVVMCIVASVLYFQWEEKQRKKKAIQLKNKAVPTEGVQRDRVEKPRPPYFSVPPMKFQGGGALRNPGIQPKKLFG